MDSTQLVKKLKENLEKRLPGQIARVVLFGSCARGEQRRDSDIDVLVIHKGGLTAQLKDAIYDECYEINLQYEVLIDVSMLCEAELTSLRGRQPYVQNALTEGLAV